MRVFDRDLIRGGHYGQRSCEPHPKGRTHGCTDQCCKREESSCQLGAVHTWHVASFRCDAMVRQLAEAKRTFASSRTKGSIEARSSFFEIGFRNVFGGGAKSTSAFCKSAPPGGLAGA